MRAVRLRGRTLKMESADLPIPGPGEVSIKVAAVGVCASDVHYYLHGAIGGLDGNGLVLGHEFAGTVAEIGPGVTSLHSGDRVCAEPGRPCAECRECLRGDYHLCGRMRFFGTPPTDGALQDRVICPVEWVFPIPDEMSFAEGAMMEPLAVATFTTGEADLRGGESCAVIGLGAIGLSVVQTMFAGGAALLWGVDPIEDRRNRAAAFGAVTQGCPSREADIAVECSGTPAGVLRCLDAVRPGGQLLLVGIPEVDEIRFPAAVARRKGVTMRFVRRYRHVFPRSIEWTRSGKVSVKSYPTHRFPLSRVGEAFELAASRRDGVVRAWIDMAASD